MSFFPWIWDFDFDFGQTHCCDIPELHSRALTSLSERPYFLLRANNPKKQNHHGANVYGHFAGSDLGQRCAGDPM